MDEQMIEVRKVAAELLGYAGEDAVAILRGDFDDKWDCLRVGKEVARVMAGKVAELEALTWFGTDTRLSLEHYSPVYCDDNDQSVEWRVYRQSGSINDREWDIAGRGETPLAAIIEARAALAPYPERRSE